MRVFCSDGVLLTGIWGEYLAVQRDREEGFVEIEERESCCGADQTSSSLDSSAGRQRLERPHTGEWPWLVGHGITNLVIGAICLGRISNLWEMRVEKTLEKRGGNTIVVRPYSSDSSGIARELTSAPALIPRDGELM